MQAGLSLLVHLLGSLAVDLATVSLELHSRFVYALRLDEEANHPEGAQILVEVVLHDKFEVVVEEELATVLITKPVAWLVLNLNRVVWHGKPEITRIVDVA